MRIGLSVQMMIVKLLSNYTVEAFLFINKMYLQGQKIQLSIALPKRPHGFSLLVCWIFIRIKTRVSFILKKNTLKKIVSDKDEH